MDWGELGRKALKAAKSGWDAGVEWTQKCRLLKANTKARAMKSLRKLSRITAFSDQVRMKEGLR